jgi:hypothetical protein
MFWRQEKPLYPARICVSSSDLSGQRKKQCKKQTGQQFLSDMSFMVHAIERKGLYFPHV